MVISVVGRLDSINAPKLVKECEAQDDVIKGMPVVLDLAECPYISSAGVRAIFLLLKQNSENGFSLRNLRPDVLDVLTKMGLSDL